ncbi:MAG TPA: hypothetical protein VHQ95_17345, partial [Pyrinomonadaceae bacterium]|nr:hypothetical protein [Pyrinomonadaceae bacterium]
MIWSVLFARREIYDAPSSVPFREAATKITLYAGRGLVAFLRSFGEQFHNDRRDTRRHIPYSLVRRHGMPRDVAMYPFKRIGSCKRQAAGQHLVKCDAEGIEIASRVDRAVH